MPTPLYMDVHAPQAITKQLRIRGVDVLTAIEDGYRTLEDDELLEHARALGRALFTRDVGFRALAEDWQRQGRPFAGLIFGHRRGTIGAFVNDLELIAKVTDPADWLSRVEHLPY